jgi:hypothetical protein
VAVYSADLGQEIVQIIRLHPGPPAPTEFYTTKILDSYDASRVGMEPQLSVSSKRLSRFNNLIIDQIVRKRIDMKNGKHKRQQFSLFTQDSESKLCWFTPSPLRLDDQKHLVKYPVDVMEYETIGIVMGLAMYNGILLANCFPLALYRLWLSPHTLNTAPSSSSSSSSSSLKPNLQDILPLHPTVATSLNSLLKYEGNIEDDFGCSYSISRDAPFINEAAGTIEQISWTETLGKSGADVPVTNSNASDYVSDYIQHVMIDDCWSRGDAIRRGFLRVVGCPALSLCSADELELMLCGSPDVGDFNELKYVTRYMGGYTLDDNAIKWFWEVVLDFPETMKRKLLLFVTGSDRVPIKGLKCLPFNIQKSGQDSDRLPTAHSCFNILDLPEYTSKEILEKRLEIALQHTIGFGLA